NISAGCSAAGACIATGTGAVATASVSGGVVNPLVVMNSYGTGYTTAPLCLFTGGGGTGATCTANIGGGQITSVTVNSGGSGYTSAPNVCFGGNGCGGSVALQIDHSNAVLFENNNVGSQCLGTPVLIDGGNNQSVEFI